ncbi:MAG: phage tail assembly protein [Syntrophomonadaceae bacterium]|jgi:hypothetical protein
MAEQNQRVKLSKVKTWEDVEYDALFLDLEGLTGNDLLQAEKEYASEGGTAPVVELNKGYLSLVAAKAAKVPVELIRDLPAKDFSQVTIMVQNFLLG